MNLVPASVELMNAQTQIWAKIVPKRGPKLAQTELKSAPKAPTLAKMDILNGMLNMLLGNCRNADLTPVPFGAGVRSLGGGVSFLAETILTPVTLLVPDPPA